MENHLTEASSQAYQDLYDNNDGMLDDLINFNKSVSIWKNNSYILGYELINEPFVGNYFEDPLLLLPYVSGKKFTTIL